MTNKSLVLMLAAATVLTVAGSACSSKKPVADENLATTTTNADENMMGDSDSGKAMGLQTVHFGYDAYTLGGDAKATLKNNAKILKDKPSVKVQIEGHCDQRGGIEYNVALGEKRANAAKKFVQDQGIAADRITVISFGKEKPVDEGTTEAAYAKNRRGNFVVTSR